MPRFDIDAALPHLPLPPRRRVLERTGPKPAFRRARIALGRGVAPLAVARIVAKPPR